jgi:hypothetical protein
VAPRGELKHRLGLVPEFLRESRNSSVSNVISVLVARLRLPLGSLGESAVSAGEDQSQTALNYQKSPVSSFLRRVAFKQHLYPGGGDDALPRL